MRIAQVAPLFESVPPSGYGGTERVVHYLTEQLVSMGHDVTLFASGDSKTSARLVPCSPAALRLGVEYIDATAYEVLEFERVAREAEAGRFDIIHYHTSHLHYPLSRRSKTAHVTTLHGRLDIAELLPLYAEYRDIPVVSISNSQRAPLPMANWQGTVYHGLPDTLYRPVYEPGSYLAFVGRISPEKGLDQAIEIATRAGVPLRVAAKVDPADRAYFEQRIRPLLSNPLVRFIGEAGDAEKQALFGGAIALLFPVDWPEPFGLVMIEALACGTPVIAYKRGSVPEVLDEGVTGFVVHNVDDAVDAVRRIHRIDRRTCRAVAMRRFSARRMAEEYTAIYARLCTGRGNPSPRRLGALTDAAA